MVQVNNVNKNYPNPKKIYFIEEDSNLTKANFVSI